MTCLRDPVAINGPQIPTAPTHQVFVQVSILPQVPRSEELRDEIDAVRVGVLPAFEALDDVGVIQVQALLDIDNHVL